MRPIKNPKQIHLYLNNRTNVEVGAGYNLLAARTSKTDNIFDEAGAWLEQANALGFNVARFTGGEPTLEMDKLCALIAKANQLGMYTTLKTNGWWANDDDAWIKLEKSGLNFLRIAYDSKFFYRGSPITKQIAMRAIGDGQKRFEMFAVITEHAEPDLEELQGLGCHVECMPVEYLTSDYRVVVDRDTVDEAGVRNIEWIEIKHRHFVIDFKGRVFTSSGGIFKAEATGETDERYIGSLRDSGFEAIYAKWGEAFS